MFAIYPIWWQKKDVFKLLIKYNNTTCKSQQLEKA